jgi:phosphoglycerol transferase MdoB-like AlkP superfamily enzyme
MGGNLNAMDRSTRCRVAVLFAIVQWAFQLFAQCANYFGCLLPPHSQFEAGLGFLVRLPLLQGDNVLVALATGLGAWVCAGRRWSRLLWLAVCALAMIYTLGDQSYFRVFLDHYRPGMTEGFGYGNLSALSSSFRAELNPAFYASAMMAGASILALFWLGVFRVPQLVTRSSMRITAAVALVGVLLLGASNFTSAPAEFENLRQNPLAVLVREAGRRPVIDRLSRNRPETGHEIAAARSRTGHIDRDPRLATLLRQNLQRNHSPNLVLIVIESVGSLQLLDEKGQPSEIDAPNLAALARRGLVFDSVYTIFPATVREHVALQTGGRAMTWGSVFEMLDHKYLGPTLPGMLATQGYATAAYTGARLDYENMFRFYQNLQFGTFYEFSRDETRQTPQYVLNSWGAKEALPVSLIETWIDNVAKTKLPFFVTYLTVATHHPYTCPPESAGPYPGADDYSHYRNATHYTDHAIGNLLAFLAQRGLLENTLIAITGDHGEAFGDRHSGNFTHKNRIYEENVKSFLIVAPPVAPSAPIVSHRLATMGDIMPTLLEFCDLRAPGIPGRSLLTQDFEEQPVFFQKSAFPEEWGLRDGRWKFIANIRTGAAELFDLIADPGEKNNLAPANKQLVSRYNAMCGDWYLRSDDQFAAWLDNFHYGPGRFTDPDQLRHDGPTALEVGHRKSDGSGEFVATSILSSKEPPLSRARWLGYPKDTPITYDWVSPSGRSNSTTFTIQAGWVVSYLPYPGPMPMEPGTWSLSLRQPNETKALISTQFTVAPPATQVVDGADSRVAVPP